ncbi:MAG TPA: hypothetical protein VFA18_13585 [Gemmataceae bacterium]|nr:hypothetical protein [Gemmataceae bacterium]
MGFKIEGYPMPARIASLDATDRTDTVLGLDGEVVELSFLLPDWQANALEAVAHGRGLTTAQMLRDILGEFFQRFAGPGTTNRISSLP